MAARLKNVVSLGLVVILIYAGYVLQQVLRRADYASELSSLQRDTLTSLSSSDVRLSLSLLRNQGPSPVVVSAEGAPIDVRSDQCRRQRYINVERLTATVVVDLPGTGVDVKQLRSNINSLLSGAQALVDELLVVAPGLQGPIATQLNDYLKELGVDARLVRKAGAGQAASRMTGAELAKSPVVVFADWRAIGTVGWLRPLLGALAIEPKSIIMPHVNDASDPAAFATTPERLLAEYTWPLSVRMFENASAVPTLHGFYRSPALRGDLFAVRREFWSQLGGYDEALGDDSAAANLELSIRAWQCGRRTGAGSILVHRCSHIGVRNLHEVARVERPRSIKYIARLWFGNLQQIMLTSTDVSGNYEDTLPTKDQDGCRGIGTYFNDIAVVPVPSSEAVRFGQLQASTDACARAHDDGRIEMTRCWPTSPHSLPSLTFELKTNGHLLTGTGQCVTVQRNSFVLMDSCTTALDEQQRWSYEELTGRLRNPWSNFCAMHVTEPDKTATNPWRQIVMAQNCTVDLISGQLHDSSTDQFMRWKFTNP